MKVFRIACTGPCGDCPPGSQKHCSEMVLVPWSDVRLPEPGAPLAPKAQEALLTLGRAVCDRIDPTNCQVWVGASTGLDTYLEITHEFADRGVIPEADVSTWLRSLVQDPECVPDVLKRAMVAADNTEALDRLVAHCIALRHKPVGELHSLNDAVPA